MNVAAVMAIGLASGLGVGAGVDRLIDAHERAPLAGANLTSDGENVISAFQDPGDSALAQNLESGSLDDVLRLSVPSVPVPDPVAPKPVPSANPSTSPAASPGASASTPVPTPVAEAGSGLLGTTVVHDLGGVLDVVAAPATVDGNMRAVRIEVERGLPVDPAVFAAAVMTTLNDPRSWSAEDGVKFVQTSGDASIRVVLASPATSDKLCAPLDTEGHLSCGTAGRAVLNFTRWVSGAADFGEDLVTYRQYLVNHEVGHLLGHGHEKCPGFGKLAPVMVQQTKSAQGCQVNGWPYPQAKG